MQLSNIPGKLVLPWATSGNKNDIPIASQIGITAGAASLTDGFPPLTMTPVAAGGVPPSGLDMNGILYEMSAILRWANAGGGYAYDSAFANDSHVGGYPKGARVMRSDGMGYWFNTVDNNTTDPEAAAAAAAGWVPDYQAGVTSVAMSGSSVTLTPAQYGKPLIVITGALSANLNLIFPTLAEGWTIINNTTGGYTITAKTASGSGVTLGTISQIVGDGTDIYAANPDSVQIVTNVATLRNVAPTLSRRIQTRGYYTDGDGGSAQYFPKVGVAPGTYVHNGGTVIVPNGGDGSAAWLLDITHGINVRQFGALGDWSGAAGTDDTNAFVACREYCRITGVKMKIPAGSYRLTSGYYFGNKGTGFPYAGFDVEGDGPNATEIVLDFNGSIGIDLNPGASGGWQAFSRSNVGAFKVTVPTGRTVNNPVRIINAHNNNIHDIHVYVPLASVTSNFVGIRVSGAVYFNTFRNLWVEVTGGDATVGKAYYVGNGLYDVGSTFANTSVNLFQNCRTRGFGIGFDTCYANAITYQSCDAEVCGVAFRDTASGWNQYNNCWTEGATTADFVLDASTYLNSDGSTAASTSSRYVNLIGPMFTGSIQLNSVVKPRLIGVYYNSIAISSSCVDAYIDATGNDTGTITGAGNYATIDRRKTTPVDHTFRSLGNKNFEWEFTSTSGTRPTSVWLKQVSNSGGFNFYRDDGSSAYHGGRVEGDVNGGVSIYGWRNQAMGSESLATPLASYGVNSTLFTSLIRPRTDNGASCGESSGRWSVVYAASGTINTSDEREKQQIKPIDEAALRAWAKVEYCQFKFNDAVEKKCDGARWHFGVIAQRVKEAFESEGLNAFEYGILCYDEWDDQYEDVFEELEIPAVDEGGREIIIREKVYTGEKRLVIAAGSRYGVRYEEALALECAYLRSKLN